MFFKQVIIVYKKEKVYCMKRVVQNLPIQGYHVLHITLKKNFKMLILRTPILLLVRII